ncbi:class I SAM-dependent methyltransferase [Roseobacter sp. YSTF-M11]|uniref:Class I SAM-dependent methyltransferase n=1 Tax=Roseobacter insulae TaxID=2859783 RepID=A0A9X1FX55_9RHOB|nr:class I SAM-dependent methyltransferase [Roseobacter insulae]MBW4708902.1 class I SAM-dependent methyltransferase [Roseobacter insulae]
MWSDVGADWIEQSRDRIWRHHSDLMTRALIEDWIPAGNTALLKTDLFDEAVSDGLYPKLQTLSTDVHAIDVAADTVDGARKKYPALKSHLCDVRDMPFEDGAFDVVVSTSTLDHFEDVADIHRALKELRRVTALGGRLLITLDNPQNPKIAMRAALPESFLMKAGLVPYHCGVTLARAPMTAAVEAAGFEVVASRAFLHCPRVLAVKVAAMVEKLSSPTLESGLLRVLRGFEHLDRLPTRWWTGHFTALLAKAS